MRKEVEQLPAYVVIDPERFAAAFENNPIIRKDNLKYRDVCRRFGYNGSYITGAIGDYGNKKFNKRFVRDLEEEFGLRFEDYIPIEAAQEEDADFEFRNVSDEITALKEEVQSQRDYLVSINLGLKKIEALLLKQNELLEKRNSKPVAISSFNR